MSDVIWQKMSEFDYALDNSQATRMVFGLVKNKVGSQKYNSNVPDAAPILVMMSWANEDKNMERASGWYQQLTLHSGYDKFFFRIRVDPYLFCEIPSLLPSPPENWIGLE